MKLIDIVYTNLLSEAKKISELSDQEYQHLIKYIATNLLKSYPNGWRNVWYNDFKFPDNIIKPDGAGNSIMNPKNSKFENDIYKAYKVLYTSNKSTTVKDSSIYKFQDFAFKLSDDSVLITSEKFNINVNIQKSDFLNLKNILDKTWKDWNDFVFNKRKNVNFINQKSFNDIQDATKISKVIYKNNSVSIKIIDTGGVLFGLRAESGLKILINNSKLVKFTSLYWAFIQTAKKIKK